MYYIKPQTEDGFFLDKVLYVQQSQTSGSYIQVAEEDAQGIATGSLVYSIDADNPLPGREIAQVVKDVDWDDEISAKYDVIVRDKAIEQKITESKIMLAQYLESHPLTWTDGKQYNVTQEKQNILMGNLMGYTLESQIHGEVELTWNATGEECVPWTFENLSALAVAIKDYVTPLVSYQQAKEVELKNCQTSQAVYNVVIDYDQVNQE